MKEKIVELLSKEVKLKKDEIKNLIEIPPNDEIGDFAFPCFSLAKIEKKSPLLVAENLAEKLRKDGLGKEIDNVEAKTGYVNFFIDKKILAEKILKEALGRDFGKQKIKLRGMIEFSQANTHKAFHVGHIRGTSIGESLARVAEFMGEKAIRVNYQGDIGMHVAKWMWCYTEYHNKEKLRQDESWIAGIYVEAVKRLTENEKLQGEVNEINRKLDSKEDKELNELWKKTRKLSLDALELIYKDLNTHFDKYYFESQFEQKGKEISHELLKRGIAEISDGAVIVNLEKYNLGVWVLLRSDGTVLYSAKDLALALQKFRDYNLDWNVYVHGGEQDLHFNQLFKVLELMGFKDIKKCYHFGFGLVRLPEGRMSSRTGDNILYSDFKKEIMDYASKEIEKRFELSKEEVKKRALIISIAAIKYSMLKQGINNVIVFNKKEALQFEGDTGPYLLYSYARASSILKKVKFTSANIIPPTKNFALVNPMAIDGTSEIFSHPKNSRSKLIKIKSIKFINRLKIIDLKKEEIALIKKLGDFPEVVRKAYEGFAPNLIANYCFELSQSFNEFYHNCPVLGSLEESLRLKIVEGFRNVLGSGLWLLGIGVLEEM